MSGSATQKRSIILLETESQVERYLKEFRNAQDITPIALSPFAMYEMFKKDMDYKVMEEFYNMEELYNLGMGNYKKVEKICSILDKHIKEHYPEVKKLNLDPAFFSLYYLKIIYDAATLRIFQISKIFKRLNPNDVFVYNSEELPFGFADYAPWLFFDSQESLYSQLLKLEGWPNHISILPQLHLSKRNYYSLKTKEKSILQFLGFFNLAKNVKEKGIGAIAEPSGSNLILFGGGYNWENCEHLFKKNNLGSFLRINDNLDYWARNRRDYSSQSKSAFNSIKNDQELRAFFKYENIDFFPFLEKRIKFLLEAMVPACIESYLEIKNLIAKKPIKALLSSSFVTPTSKSAAKAAHNYKIPVFGWQHGGYGFMDQPIIVYQDLISPDVHFVFGKGVYEKYSDLEEKCDTLIVPMGSSVLDSIKSNAELPVLELNPNKKTILYASTNFYQNSLYVSFSPAFSDNLLWITQKSILNVLGRHPEFNVIVKTHPNKISKETRIRAYSSEKDFHHCKFVRDEYSFKELLPLADIVILDLPITTLLESLTTNKPIFTTTTHYNIDPQALDILKKRVYCSSNIKDFVNLLNNYFDSKELNQKVDLNNGEFLKLYGTHLDDGQSAQRAVDFIKKALSS